MTSPVMPPIEIQGIPREKMSHELRDSLGTAEKQEVVGHEHPCEDPCLGGDNELTDTTQKGFTIRIISKDVGLLDPLTMTWRRTLGASNLAFRGI